MGCRILAGEANGTHEAACLYDSVTDTAFGPLFEDVDEADAFMSWLRENAGRKDFPKHSTLHKSMVGEDPREYDDHALHTLVDLFRDEIEADRKAAAK